MKEEVNDHKNVDESPTSTPKSNEFVLITSATEKNNSFSIKNNDIQPTFSRVGGFNNPTPLWVPDSVTNNCHKCGTSFSLLKRKHHCRACGNIFCKDCSDHKMQLEANRDKQRVCSSCFEKRKTNQRY